MLDNYLPVIAPVLWRAYHQKRRAWAAEIGFPFPERRSRKRKPIPGLLEPAEDEG